MTEARLAVIILAAGEGTRMKSTLPKVLHPLAGMPLIGHVLATAENLGAEQIIAVVRHNREVVATAINQLSPNTIIVDQDEIPGTGRAAEVALGALPADFEGQVVVLSADVPLLDAETLRSLIADHLSAGNALTLLTAIFADPTGAGRVIRAGDGAFEAIVEQKDATEDQLGICEVNAGVYVFDAAGLRRVLATIGTTNAQNEKYLTDAAAGLKSEGGRIAAVSVSDAAVVAGINDRVQLSDVAIELNRRILRRWQLAGVTIQDPASTWIDVNATLNPDVTLLPGTQILGATVIARGATVGPDTTLIDCEIGEDARVRRTDANLAVIAANATVGPFSYLRPGTYLGADGKIGAFVETKNARIGSGSKVPHLSYVGDATVGEQTNIGAGTIFANYDGLHKHESQIGNHVRSGAANVFVAPITIGDGAYTAAGTVVRKDVPAGSLALNVAPQRNIADWVETKRPGSAAARAAAENGE